MPFDPSTAKPLQSTNMSSGFDPSTARPMTQQNFIPDIAKEKPNLSPGLQDPGSWSDTFNDLKSVTSAAGQGFFHGMDEFATTIGKALSRTSDMRKAWQYTFDANTAQYNSNKDTNKHPLIAGAAHLAGDLLATSPSMLVGGPLAGAVQGASFGLATQPGQDPDKIADPKNIAINAMAGHLMYGIGGTLSNYGRNVDKIEQWYNKYPDVKQMASDIEGGATQSFTNNILQRIPIAGTGPYRANLAKQYSSLIQEYVGDVSNQTMNRSVDQIAKTLQSHATDMNNLERDAWNKLTTEVSKAGIDTVSTNISRQGLDNVFLTNAPKDLGPNLSKMKDLALSDNLSPKQVLDLKRTIWDQSQFLQKKLNANTASATQKDLIPKLQDAYWNLIDDYKQAVSGTPAESAFQAANSITQGTKMLTSNVKGLADGIADVNSSRRDTQTFIMNLLKPNIPQRELQQTMGFLGDDANKQLATLHLKNLLVNSLDYTNDKPVVNLTKWLSQMNQIPNKVQSLLDPDLVNSLKGLQVAVGNWAKDVRPTQVNAPISNGIGQNISPTAVGLGSLAALYTHPVATSAAIASTAALSAIARYAPLKQTLIQINKAAEAMGANPGTIQNTVIPYLVKQLPRLGAFITNTEIGPMLDTKKSNINVQVQTIKPTSQSKVSSPLLADNTPNNEDSQTVNALRSITGKIQPDKDSPQETKLRGITGVRG